jgi:DNA-directed RNA polymerase specialized sigma24 family protein
MYDRNAPSSMRVIELIKKREIRERLMRIAFKKTHERAAAEDLIAEALMHVMDPDDLPWAKGTFLGHMGRVMQHVWGRQLRGMGAQEVPEDGIAIDQKTRSRESPADEAADRRASLQVLEAHATRLLAVCEERNPRAKQCLELIMQGCDLDELAPIMGCSKEEVTVAHRFLKRNGALIRDEWLESERQRMQALRDRATKTGEAEL